jgi:hypothetical protein
MKLILAYLVLLFASGFVLANDVYLVDAKIYENDQLLFEPKVKVEGGKIASISVHSDSGEVQFRLELTVREAGVEWPSNSVDVSSKLELHGEMYEPRMVFSVGEEATVTVDRMMLSYFVTRPDS